LVLLQEVSNLVMPLGSCRLAYLKVGVIFDAWNATSLAVNTTDSNNSFVP